LLMYVIFTTENHQFKASNQTIKKFVNAPWTKITNMTGMVGSKGLQWGKNKKNYLLYVKKIKSHDFLSKKENIVLKNWWKQLLQCSNWLTLKENLTEIIALCFTFLFDHLFLK
jgi:hypothetical protein